MKIQTYLFGIFLIVGCSSVKNIKPVDTAAISLSDLKLQIDSILQDSAMAQTQVGIKIVSLRTGQIIYEHDSEKLFHPASNMKLLSTATALVKLGPNFKFKTQLLADTSVVQDSVITGNLYLKGHGNPDLRVADLRWLAAELTKSGIRKITGDLICDDSFFDDYRKGYGWMWDDVSDWYYAPISALNLNENCVEISVKPGEQVGDSLEFHLEPKTAHMRILSTGLTVDSLDTLKIREFKVERRWRPAENIIDISGGMIVGARERTYTIDVVDGALYTGALLSEVLTSEAIEIFGSVKNGVAPDTSILIAEHLSEPLTEVVFHTNKVSYNLGAEALVKTLGAHSGQMPGTAARGLSTIKQYFNEFKVDTTGFRLADGSGSSRYILITPSQIVALLQTMHKDFRVQAEFKSSLPIAGVDGTLKNRMKGTPAQGKLRAKTGTLSGVAALSGYTATADGEHLVFSMIMSHYVGSSRKIRNVQDKIGALISGVSLTY